MPKLVRMIADKSVSNTVIENTFNPAFNIEPNSRIALQSVNANLLRTSNDIFSITAFNNTLSVDGYDITLDVDDYDSGTFVTDMISNITWKGGSTASPGINLDVKVNNDAISFEKYACALLPPDAGWPDWILAEGEPDLTTAGVFRGDGTADPVTLLASYLPPNASYTFSGQVSTPGSITFGINIGGGWSSAIEIQDGSNQYILHRPDGSPVNTGVTAQSADNISIVRTRNSIVYTCGAYTNTYDYTLVNQEYFNSSIDKVLSIQTAGGSNVNIGNFKFTIVDDNQTSSILKTSRTTLTMAFGSESLAKYCGFSTTNPAAQSGDPAIVAAGAKLKGDPIAPGILVCIDPMILESYDGDQRNVITGGNRRNGRNNILYVLQSTNPDLVQQETFPIPLSIRNKETMQINQLRVTFKDQTNGRILQFNGEPSVVLVIYGPGE